MADDAPAPGVEKPKKVKRQEYVRQYLAASKIDKSAVSGCRRCSKQPVLRGFINGGRKR